jgi:hypothetical protein
MFERAFGVPNLIDIVSAWPLGKRVKPEDLNFNFFLHFVLRKALNENGIFTICDK